MDRSFLTSLSDDQLLRDLSDLLARSRRDEAALVAHIGEIDARRLYAREACPSMFAYCTEVLHLSEAEAYLRITAARASRAYPEVLDRLRDGRIHLSGLARLAPHLTAESAEGLLERVTHRSKREILELIAEIAPRPDVPATVRRLPATVRRLPATGRPLPVPVASGSASAAAVAPQSPALLPGAHGTSLLQEPGKGERSRLCPGRVESPRPPSPTQAVEPLSPGRYKVQFTADAALQAKLERLQRLLQDRLPEAGLAAVIDIAVTETLERLETRRWGARKAPVSGAPKPTPAMPQAAKSSRHIPAEVRRLVHERDDGRCRYRSQSGRRCTERVRLEIHHRHPYGFGGDRRPVNLSLLCKAHNRLLGEHDYGPNAMLQRSGGSAGARAPVAVPLTGLGEYANRDRTDPTQPG